MPVPEISAIKPVASEISSKMIFLALSEKYFKKVFRNRVHY
jgi:hypothetical protein